MNKSNQLLSTVQWMHRHRKSLENDLLSAYVMHECGLLIVMLQAPLTMFNGHLQWIAQLGGQQLNNNAAQLSHHITGNVTSAGWQVTLCDPIWHVSSRSGEACCELLYPVTLLYFT